MANEELILGSLMNNDIKAIQEREFLKEFLTQNILYFKSISECLPKNEAQYTIVLKKLAQRKEWNIVMKEETEKVTMKDGSLSMTDMQPDDIVDHHTRRNHILKRLVHDILVQADLYEDPERTIKDNQDYFAHLMDVKGRMLRGDV